VPLQRARRTRRRRRLVWLLAFVGVVIAAIAGTGVYGAILWQRIDRIDTGGALSPSGAGFVNYLVVGTDDRSTLSATDPAASDVGLGMIILHTGDDGNRIVSLPRDLWVDVEGLGPAKLNAALGTGGPERLVTTVRTRLGIPIHRYLQVDLAGFMSVIDTIGGIDVDFPRAACDPKSGLAIRTPGPVRRGRVAALAYVRSRSYTEFDPADARGLDCEQIMATGLGDTDPTGDIGRTERQREVLIKTLTKAAGSRNPFRLLGVASGLSGGLTVDDEMGFWDAVALLRTARGLDAETLSLPVSAYQAPGGASALRLDPGAGDVIALFSGSAGDRAEGGTDG
jgi:LCP family protein required for cell wall assembly